MILIKIYKWQIIIIGMAVTLLPIIINYMLLTWRMPGAKGTSDVWIGFFGSYIGSLITGLVTVFVFIKTTKYYKDKDERDDKVQIEQRRLSLLPYMNVVNIGAEDDILDTNIYRFTVDDEDIIKCRLPFEITNVGLGNAVQVEYKCINTKNSVTNLKANSCLQINKPMKLIFYISYSKKDLYVNNKVVEQTIRISFRDLLGNNYKQDINISISDIIITLIEGFQAKKYNFVVVTRINEPFYSGNVDEQ